MSMPALSPICTRICPCEQHEGGNAIVSHADILLVAKLSCAALRKQKGWLRRQLTVSRCCNRQPRPAQTTCRWASSRHGAQHPVCCTPGTCG